MGLPLSETATDKFSYSAEEQRAARMPSDLHALVGKNTISYNDVLGKSAGANRKPNACGRA
jgi:hypothetical protein